MANPIKVLMVEDSEEDAELIVRAIRKGACPAEFGRVETAAALKAALEQQTWDIILCDYALPEFTGLEALQIVRIQALDLPFILVSGVVGEETAVALMKAGADDFIMKDNLARLVPAMQRELREAGVRRERRRAVEAFEKLFLNAPIGIFLVQDGRFKMVNPGFLDITRYEEGDLLGKGSLSLLPADNGRVLKENLVQRLKTKSTLPYELLFLDGEGTPRWVEETVVSTKYGGKRATLGYFMEVTQRKQAEEALAESLQKVQKTLDGTIRALGSTLEIRDPYTAGHQKRVAQLAYSIGKEMGLPEDQSKGIEIMGCLHDIGKIAVPAEILSKPSRLNHYEFNLIKNHSQMGHDILQEIESPWPLAQVILQHHERLDGSGYPRGLAGDDILLEARILGVADVVEAMASHRPYRPALGVSHALEEISRNRGVLYDPEVAETCLTLFNEKGFQFE